MKIIGVYWLYRYGCPMEAAMTHFTYAMRIATQFGIRRALTFWRAVLREPKAMDDWREFLATHVPEGQREGMLLRCLRPYMRQHFTPEQRRALLRDHTLRVNEFFVMDEWLMTEPGMVVATLVGKNDARYTLHIGGNTSKEGEMAFGIYDASGHYLAKMAATVGNDESGKPVLWVGGLQGAKPPMGRDEVVKATKDCFGLRPKGAVMLAAQVFAGMLGLTALRAPGKEGHISQRGLNRIRSKRKIYADYGQFWEEIGGHHAVVSDGVLRDEYVIPVIPQVRDVSEVKPHKRSEWKKRQALSEDLAAQTLAALASVQR